MCTHSTDSTHYTIRYELFKKKIYKQITEVGACKYLSKINLEKEPPFLFETVAVYKPLLTTNSCLSTDDTGEDIRIFFVSRGALALDLVSDLFELTSRTAAGF